MDFKRDLEFLYEMGSLRYIKRAWTQFGLPDVASVSEHTFRVIWFSMIIAKHENLSEESINKVVKIALVHDIGESRSGDLHYMSRLYAERDENKAVAGSLKDTSLEKLKELWEEFDNLSSKEAKVVKDADNLEFEMELHESHHQGYTVNEHFKRLRSNTIPKKLHTETAKKLFDEIRNSNPHDWHIKGPNRHTVGDLGMGETKNENSESQNP